MSDRAPESKRLVDIDNPSLKVHTEQGARSMFRRFLLVAIGLQVLMAIGVVVYDVADNTSTMRDNLETQATQIARITDRLRAAHPELSEKQLVTQAARLTGSPMALLKPDGTLAFATNPAIARYLPIVFEPRAELYGRRFPIKTSFGSVSGAWVVRPFTHHHHLLVIVPRFPEDEGKLRYMTVSAGVIGLGILVSFLVLLATTNWILRRPLNGLVRSLTDELVLDIKKRRAAEKEAIRAQDEAERHAAFVANLLNAADEVGIIGTDNVGVIRVLNHAAIRILGYDEQQVVGKMTLNELLDHCRGDADAPFSHKSLVPVDLGEEYLVAQDGHEVLLSMRHSNIVGAAGEAIGHLLVFVDIGERKQLEADLRLNELQLIQASKLAGLGEMATGVAHELNQPLNNIALLTSRVLRRLSKQGTKDEFVTEKLAKIQGQVQRAGKIIEHLRTFGRPTSQSMTTFPVERPVNAVIEMVHQQLVNRNIALDVDIPEGLPEVVGDEAQLEQVFINLVNNARDALADYDGESDPAIFIEASAITQHDQPWVRLDVIDNGPGMSEQVRRRVFEPFFTTKEVGKGTGLGLSISYGLIKGFGGQLLLESTQGQGAVFSILLKTQRPDPK